MNALFEELAQQGKSVEGESREGLVGEAKELRKRAEKIMDIIDETDAYELQALIKQTKDAIAGGDIERVAELNESLSDMLFYLED